MGFLRYSKSYEEGFERGKKIIEYIGEKITKEESKKREKEQEEIAKKDNRMGAIYTFELDENFDIDGNIPENTAKYINHSCNPNCETDIIDDHIWIISIKDIKKGEELTYDYCFDLENFEKYPCRCNTGKCAGYIVDEEYREEVKKRNQSKIKEKDKIAN